MKIWVYTLTEKKGTSCQCAFESDESEKGQKQTQRHPVYIRTNFLKSRPIGKQNDKVHATSSAEASKVIP